jgi:hypothetical protein
MTLDHKYLTWCAYINLFMSRQQRWSDPTTPEKKFSRLHLSARLSGPWDPPQFLSLNSHWSSRLNQASVDSMLLGLLGPYHQHAIGTFNTCSRGPTHRSLTNTGEGYNLRGAGFSHHTPQPSQPMILRFPSKGPARSQVNLLLVDHQHLADLLPWIFDSGSARSRYIICIWW